MENCGAYFETGFVDDYRFKRLSDGKLRTEDGCTFYIHKYTLAKNSKYFYALFCGMGMNKEDVLIPGITGEVLNSILSYIYNHQVKVTDENVYELMIASDYLMMDDLLSEVKMFLTKNLTAENCLSIFLAAVKVNRQDLLWECYRFVQTHFESVIFCSSAEIGELPLEILKQLISDKSLCVRNERTVHTAMVKWVEADTANRLSWVPDLIAHLVIAEVEEDLATEILRHDTVSKNPFCQGLVDMKTSFPNSKNLNIIELYFENYPKPIISVHDHRLPAKLNCIAHYTTHDRTDRIEIFITYDEKMDLWRKILEFDLRTKYMDCVGSCLYMFRTNKDLNYRYNIVDKQWYNIQDFTVPRRSYAVVKLEENIYALGGISTRTEDEIYSVEVYDCHFHIWFRTTSMIPVSCFGAVALNSFIYVVGHRIVFGEYEMIAQVYDSRSEIWNLLPNMSIDRRHFALASYLDKIYVMGGKNENELSKAVEVFDPAKNEWKIEPDLPYAYVVPRAAIIHGLLVVYDSHMQDRGYLKTNPPVFYNREGWEHFEEASLMNNLHVYQFITLENSKTIRAITNENRHPDTHFEKSPFN